MGTIVAQSSVGEPLLATGLAGTTDFTFKQLRQMAQMITPGVVDRLAFKVSAGAGMSVDIADGAAWVAGTTDATYDGQQKYGVPGVSATINLSGITAPVGATRRDMVVIRAYDNAEDGGAGITADSRVQYIKNAAETTTAEATPANSQLLAYVDVTVGAGSITAAMITDMRPVSSQTGQAAKFIIPSADTTTSASFTKLTNADQVPVHIENGDILEIRFKAQWKISAAAGTQTAAIFIGANQLRYPVNGSATPGTAGLAIAPLGTFYSHLGTTQDQNSLASQAGSVADPGLDLQTGQMMATINSVGATVGMPIFVDKLLAGDYMVSVQFKTSAGTLSVQDRRLYARVHRFAGA